MAPLRALNDPFSRFQRPNRTPDDPEAPTGNAPVDLDKLRDLVERRFCYSRDAKQPLLRIWATCLAFYCGDHYRQWSYKQRRLVQNERIPAWRVQMVDNQIPGSVEIGIAKLARTRDLPRALPDGDDDEARATAEANTKALSHWWQRDEMEYKELDANLQRSLFGAAFFHDFWDPDVLGKVPYVKGYTVDRATGAMVEQVGVEETPVGDVCTEVLSVFDVFPEPSERWEDVRWCIVASRKPLAWFKDTFENGGEIKPEKGDDSGVYDQLIPSHAGMAARMGTGGTAPSGEGYATLKIYYERPCKTYPKGRHLMVAGNVLLFHRDQLPLPHGRIPLTMDPYRLVPKRLWPMGNVEGLLGPQRELNRAQSYMIEALRLFGRPQRLAPKGALEDPKEWTTDPDRIVEYDARFGIAPQYLQPPQMPAWVDEMPEKLRSVIYNLSGQHEVSRASVPGGVTAASAIRLLQEQDDTRLAVPALLGKKALVQLSQNVLATQAARYREPRRLTLAAQSGVEIEHVDLNGSDLSPARVEVKITEGVASSDAYRTENLLAWWPVLQTVFMGGTPPEFVIRVLRELNEGWLADALEAAVAAQQQRAMQVAQVRQAQAEEEAQAQGAQQEQAALQQQQQAQLQQEQQMREMDAAQQDGDTQRQHELTLTLMKGALAQQGKAAPR